MAKHSILCVDDETDNLDALERLLRKKYHVLKASSGAEGLELLDENRVTVIISDQRMPKMTGVEFLAQAIKIQPNAIRLLLTGYADIEVVIEAINSGGIYRYINKPWDPNDLVNAVDKAVERFELASELVRKNVELQAALDELKVLDEAKTQFMMLINHELKTPLTALQSFSGLLNETKLDEEQRRYLSRIDSAGNRLLVLVNDSLELVRAESRLVQVQLASVSSAQLFNDKMLTAADTEKLKSKSSNIDFQIEPAKLLIDEVLVKSAVQRLLKNAIQYADAETKILVKGEVHAGLYQLAIINRAPDIPTERIKTLLRPFTLNENKMNHSGGNGLGLAIARATLALLNSSLHIESKNQTVQVSFELSVQPGAK